MRRLLPLVLPLALLFTSTPAQAGPGAVLRAIAKLGSIGAKGGKFGGLAGKGLKSGAAFKGAKMLGAGTAARQVFQHAGTDGARVGLYIADDGAGALRVVTESGDELVKSTDELKHFVDDLDAMADVSADAGVDLFLDADVLPKLGQLDVGANTRLWIANVDGPSLPLRKGADGVAEVAAVGNAGAARLWFRATTEAVQWALRLSQQPGSADTVLIEDRDCSEVTGGRVVADPKAALATASGTVVLLTDNPVGDALEAVARDQGIDLIVVPGQDLCDAEGRQTASGVAALERAEAATTVGELWAIGATVTAPLVVDDVRDDGQWMAVRGAALAAFHPIATAAPIDDEPPAWVYGLGLGLGIVVAGFVVRRERNKEKAAS